MKKFLMSQDAYEITQGRLTRLMSDERLRLKRYTGKRAEGYKDGVLAAKSLIREMFKDGWEGVDNA